MHSDARASSSATRRRWHLAAAIIAALFTREAAAQTVQAQHAGAALQTLLVFSSDDHMLPLFVVPLVNNEIATFPTASSSAGFTYRFNPQLGVPVLMTKSFGPLFVERPNTAGRGQLAISVDVQSTKWRSLDGLNLSHGGIHTQVSNSGFSQSFINLRSSVSVVGATFGVTDRLDVGVSVPLVTTTVSGRYTAFDGHFAGEKRGISRGIGDITLRSKVQLVNGSGFGIATLFEHRAPTGDAAQLLGLGRQQNKFLLVVAERGESVSHHFNIGYTFAGPGVDRHADGAFGLASDAPVQPSDEINYSAGLDVAVHPRVTAAADVIGRVLLNTVQVRPSGGTTIVMDFIPKDRRTLLVGVVGMKLNVVSRWILRANVLFPLTSNGLEPGITPVLGLERAF